MHARVLRMQLKVDKVGEASRLFNKTVVPLCRKQKGFKGAFFMTESSKTGQSMVVTLWETEEAMLATEENRFFQEQVARFIPFYVKPPIRWAYELVLKEEMEKGK